MERVHPLDPLGHSADWTKETTSLSLTGDVPNGYYPPSCRPQILLLLLTIRITHTTSTKACRLHPLDLFLDLLYRTIVL